MSIDFESSVWRGERVRLRVIEPGDWETYFAWNGDDERARNLLWFIPLPQSQEAVRRWAEQESLRRPEGDNFRFVIDHAGEVVGDLTTHRCNARIGKLSYGLNIRREHRRKGFASDAIRTVLRYYFRELRYQKVTVAVYSDNEASIRLHEKLGFQQEGRLRRTVFTDGRFFDELLFGLTVEEFEATQRQ
jgi:RimJ/RimL family protein N-acetyltransferase